MGSFLGSIVAFAKSSTLLVELYKRGYLGNTYYYSVNNDDIPS